MNSPFLSSLLTSSAPPTALVSIVDDDPSVRKALERLLLASGFTVLCFASGEDFLASYDPRAGGCLVLDLSMPGLSGHELQVSLKRAGGVPRIIFLTGHADVRDSVQAMKRGATEFLTKPVDDAVLLDAVHTALELDRCARVTRAVHDGVLQRIALLTPREHEVFGHVVTGKLNKQIADDLGTTEKTVKVHRARAMKKMQARSLAELVRLAVSVELTLQEVQ